MKKDIYLGMPVKKDKNGVEKIIELGPNDKILFAESQKEVDKTLKLLS